MAVLGLILSIICCLAPFSPFKTCFNACGYVEPEFADESYDKVCLTFSSDYDKENPLTIKSGQLRLLDHQIKKATADGEEGTLATLMGQKQMVSQQGAFAQMQQYAQANQARQAAYTA